MNFKTSAIIPGWRPIALSDSPSLHSLLSTTHYTAPETALSEGKGSAEKHLEPAPRPGAVVLQRAVRVRPRSVSDTPQCVCRPLLPVAAGKSFTQGIREQALLSFLFFFGVFFLFPQKHKKAQ